MTRKSNPYTALIELLAGKACARYRRLDFEAWAAACGLSESTLRRRFEHPEKIQLGELLRIARSLGISGEELLRAALRVVGP